MTTPPVEPADPAAGAIAVQLEQLRLAVDVQQLALHRLQADLASLRAGQLDLSDALPPPWCWRDADPDTAAALWEELSAWVAWLHTRYPLAEVLPSCWWRHPELVEELTAAHAAWTAAYAQPGAAPTAPAEWHDRWLPGLEHRLRERWKTGRCQPTHTDRQPTAHGNPLDDTAAYRDHIAADLVRRRGEDRDWIATPAMSRLLGRGTATRLGNMPGSPVHHDNAYWAPEPSGYRRITEPQLTARLNRDQARLAAADAASAAGRP